MNNYKKHSYLIIVKDFSALQYNIQCGLESQKVQFDSIIECHRTEFSLCGMNRITPERARCTHCQKQVCEIYC